MKPVLVSLGSNLGDSVASLQQAVATLSTQAQVTVESVSSWHRTRPIGGPAGQPKFTNGALILLTEQSPRAVLELLQSIERQQGRQRGARWQARTLDLDLLLYADLQLDEAGLKLPHPRMTFRRFVLEPAVEIAADWLHPQLGWTLRQILQHLDSSPPYVAVVGHSRPLLQKLVSAAAQQTRFRTLSDPVPDTAASPSTAREIEFLGQRGARLRQAIAASQSADDEFVVSAFWWPQSLMAAALHDTLDLQLIQEEVLASQAAIPTPRLLVVVTASVSGEARFLRALDDYLSRHPPAPILRVDGGDLPGAVQELAAAIDALRPTEPGG